MDLETTLRQVLYEITLQRGTPPTASELSALCAASHSDVRAALGRLAEQRIVVVQPANGELLMVPPFSAVPTPFVVQSDRHMSYANCAWDALGAAVMLRESAGIVTSCGCCGDAMHLRAHRDAAPEGNGIIHFAVPARHWWDDVVFT